jgi:hypothetical protein
VRRVEDAGAGAGVFGCNMELKHEGDYKRLGKWKDEG